MSSVHIHLHIQPSCHAHEQARQQGSDKSLGQGIAAMIVLALLERLMQAASQSGAAKHCHEHGSKSPALEGGGQAGQAAGVQTHGQDGDGSTGVVQQFMALLILLALLCGHKGGHGSAHGTADEFADKLSDKLADKAADEPQGAEVSAPEAEEVSAPEAEEVSAPEAEEADYALPDVDEPRSGDGEDAFEDPTSMMLGAMRQGRAESLMAGKDDAAFERSLQAMARDLRHQLGAG
jgi:hypothetical protein